MENADGDLELELFASASDFSSVSVAISAPKATNIYGGQDIEITPGDVMYITLPQELRMEGSEIAGNGIYITATDDIVVYGLNKADASCSGFLIHPVDTLGMEYIPIAWWPPTENTQLAIVATQDNTNVEIYLHPTHGNTVEFDGEVYVSGDTIKVELNAFETLQIQDITSSDVTGSLIKADKPIAAFSGNKYTSIPQ